MSLLDALGCPYCGSPLLKESYYFRCGCEHRFAAAVERVPAASGDGVAGGTDGLPCGADGQVPPTGDSAAPTRHGPARLVLRVLSHPDRSQIGRTYAYPLEEGRPWGPETA